MAATQDKRLSNLIAEIRRHERTKRERGELTLADKALHHRAKHIAKK